MSGLKCYAICPFYAKTDLVKEENFGRLERAFKTQLLEIEEVGEALMKSFESDESGSCHAVVPLAPTMTVPNFGPPMWKSLFIFGKITQKLPFELDIINPYVLFGLMALTIFGLLNVACCIVSAVF